MYQVNEEITKQILSSLPAEKRKVLTNACIRNQILTSCYGLENCTMRVYKEGFQIILDGCRANFKVYCKDNDGTFEIARKPAEKTLHLLYTDWGKTEWIIDLTKVTDR